VPTDYIKIVVIFTSIIGFLYKIFVEVLYFVILDKAIFSDFSIFIQKKTLFLGEHK